ncbi:MAG TPA: cyclic pyranopterin monophosphate synthase MoaC [Nitriliruptoraceae bacterium]|nr:cyclic pyranopterin monophosphate synthase MoaC [Nitriliruptoraceae bacterium]
MPDGTGDTGRPGSRRDGLTHLDEDGHAHMVEVGAKPITARTAVARATVVMAPATAARVAGGDLPKGDALPLVRLAGIQAAKLTPQLIPLCHQVAVTSVEVTVDVDAGAGRVDIVATARARDRTGVEMEAMTAASVASLALYDMVKAVQRDVRVTEVVLVSKSGGRSGDWHADE